MGAQQDDMNPWTRDLLQATEPWQVLSLCWTIEDVLMREEYDQDTTTSLTMTLRAGQKRYEEITNARPPARPSA